MMKTHIGIDYSLTCPCVCINTDDVFEHSFFYYLTDRKAVVGKVYNIYGELHEEYTSDQQRFENIGSWVVTILSNFTKSDLNIYIEDYSFGSKGRVFHLAENCGIMKYRLYKGGFTFSCVPPTVVKKFATGKGNATKDGMYDAFVKETGIKLHTILSPTTKLGSPTTDVVDAWYISKYARAQAKQ